ncbi:MAG: LysE family transporter [Opitutaceae bacterium]|nr:LysE family transporter [Opitutaceae bacterium]
MHNYGVEFLQVAIAHLLAVASPGPDFAIVLRQSLEHGRRTAIWTSIGIGTGIFLHVAYSLLGLGLLVRSSELWFTVVKYLGAAYLAWLGVQSLRARARSDVTGGNIPPGAIPAHRGAFATGFLTNVLNPKATLFFISLFVIVVSPQTPKPIQAGYGIWMAAATMGWFCFVSLVFTRDDVRGKFLRHGHWIDRALGIVFLGFAATLALGSLK